MLKGLSSTKVAVRKCSLIIKKFKNTVGVAQVYSAFTDSPKAACIPAGSTHGKCPGLAQVPFSSFMIYVPTSRQVELYQQLHLSHMCLQYLVQWHDVQVCSMEQQPTSHSLGVSQAIPPRFAQEAHMQSAVMKLSCDTFLRIHSCLK